MERLVSLVVVLILFGSPIVSTEPDYRIINGVLTAINEFPFMVAFGWTNNETGATDFLSGGMLIAPNYVLTTAHSVFLKGKLPSTVLLGGNDLNSTFNDVNRVIDFVIHPEYNEKLAYYDIALLKLEKNSEKSPVCLWTNTTLDTNNVTAIGYGVTQFAGSTTAKLQKVNLTAFPEELCKPFFRRQRKFRSGIKHSHLCAGDPEGRKDTCQGDSGGPLLVESDGQIYAAGITSTGQACSGFPPAIYTRISSYIEWIEEIIKKDGHEIATNCAVSSGCNPEDFCELIDEDF